MFGKRVVLMFCALIFGANMLRAENVRGQVFKEMQVRGLSDKEEVKGGRTCWDGGWITVQFELSDPSKPVVIEVDILDSYEIDTIAVNTCGTGKSTRNGGVWTKIRPDHSSPGQEQWVTLIYNVPIEVLAPGQKIQRFGMGGGGHHAWIADVRILQ